MPRPQDSNIDITERGVAERLQKLRVARPWTMAELAEASALSERTIRDIERGRRERVQEATLMSIARALDVELEFLLDGVEPETGDPDAIIMIERRRIWPYLVTPLLIVIAVLSILLLRSDETAPLELAQADPLAYVDSCWGAEHGGRVLSAAFVEIDGRRLVVYGLDTTEDTQNQLLVRDFEDGRLLWSDSVAADEVARVFGENQFFHQPFRAALISTCDMDGDGARELAVTFNHYSLYPSLLRLYTPEGERIDTYYNYGRISDLLIEDLDDDGKDEIVLMGTNNGKAYQAGTAILLDETHRHGASTDPRLIPDCPLPDSCCVRVVFPMFPDNVRRHCRGVRTWLRHGNVFRDADGAVRIAARLGMDPSGGVMVVMDADLRPLALDTTDKIIRQATDWPAEDAAFLEPETLSAWAEGAYRFGACVTAP